MATLDTTLTATQCLLLNDNRHAKGGVYLNMTPADFQERLTQLKRTALKREFDTLFATLTEEEKLMYEAYCKLQTEKRQDKKSED